MNIKQYKYDALALSDPKRKERNLNLNNLALECQKNFDEKKFLLIWEELEGYINWYLRKVVNWIPGYTRDCIITECRTMLYTHAIKNYKPICINKKGEEVAVSFRYWAIMVMKGHIISTLDDTKLNKNKIVNYALHLDWQAGEDEEDKLEDVLKNDNQLSPIEEIIRNEDENLINNYNYNFIINTIKKYSNKPTVIRYTILINLFMQNRNYKVIAERMSKITGKKITTKSVDNMIGKIRKKLILNKENYEKEIKY